MIYSYNINVKCNLSYYPALEALCAQKDEEIAAKDKMIQELQQKVKELELTHKQRLQELTIRTQQEIYIAKKQAENQLKKKRP